MIHMRGRLKWRRHSEDEKETKQPSSLCANSVLGSSICIWSGFACLLACFGYHHQPPAPAPSSLSHRGGSGLLINRLEAQSISRSPGCLSMHPSQVKPGWGGSIQGLLWLLSQCVGGSIDASEARPEWAIGYSGLPAKRKEGLAWAWKMCQARKTKGFPPTTHPWSRFSWPGGVELAIEDPKGPSSRNARTK